MAGSANSIGTGSSDGSLVGTLSAGLDKIIGAKAQAIATQAAQPPAAKGTPQAVSHTIGGFAISSGVILAIVGVVLLLLVVKKGR